MDGAKIRMQNKRSLVWWGAMMPTRRYPPKHDEFAGVKAERKSDILACIAAWDRIDRALMGKKKKRQS